MKYSQDAKETRLAAFCRRAICRTLGFDIVHAWRNRAGLRTADVVWTHTEREHLAALLLFRLLGIRKAPRVIAQCIWLFDGWPRFSRPRRWLYLWLLRQADVITTHSPENLNVAHLLLPGCRTELVMFGINAECIKAVRRSVCHRPVRVATLGSDMHRDWETLFRALGNIPDFEVRIASSTVKPRFTRGAGNISVKAAQSREQVERLYEWADIVLVPLNHNLHASGLSVILEATLSGLPVVATDTGGLRAYFSNQELQYVPVGDATAIRRAVSELANGDDRRFSLATRAQRRIIDGRLTSETYALHHRRLSEELLGTVRLRDSRFVDAPPSGLKAG